MLKIFKEKINVYLMISFSICMISILVIGNYTNITAKYEIDKELFLRKFKTITIENSNNLTLLKYLDILKDNCDVVYSNPFAFTANTIDGQYILEVYPIYEKKPYIYKDLQGQYFSTNDFDIGNRVAIIGSNVEKLCYIKDNKKYINIKIGKIGFPYEVIGIMDDNRFTSTSIQIPYESLLNTELENYSTPQFNFMINADSNEKLPLSDQYSITHYNKVNLLDITYTNLKRNFDEIKNLILCLALGCINLITFSFFWIKSTKRKFSIFKLLGASNIYLLKYILKNMLFIGLFSSIFSTMFSYLILDKIGNVVFITTPSNLVIANIITFLLAVGTSLISFKDVLQFNITKYIR